MTPERGDAHSVMLILFIQNGIEELIPCVSLFKEFRGILLILSSFNMDTVYFILSHLAQLIGFNDQLET